MVVEDSKSILNHPPFPGYLGDVKPVQKTCLDNHLSTSLRSFSLPLEVGPNERGQPWTRQELVKLHHNMLVTLSDDIKTVTSRS